LESKAHDFLKKFDDNFSMKFMTKENSYRLVDFRIPRVSHNSRKVALSFRDKLGCETNRCDMDDATRGRLEMQWKELHIVKEGWYQQWYRQ